MPQKGFTVIVNGLHIHAMRSADAHEVQARKSDAQYYNVYSRSHSDELVLVQSGRLFDSAFEFCVAPPTLH